MNVEVHDQPVLGAGEAWPAEAWTLMGVQVHPVCPLPDDAWLRAHTFGELVDFLNEREEVSRRMAADPVNYGWEPSTWTVLDALCGFPWADPAPEVIAIEMDPARKQALGAQRDWCLRVRRVLLKQDEAIRVLLLNGGNRGSKSEWAASRVMKLLLGLRHAKAWCFHQDADMSVEYQQPLLYKYLPSELKTEKGIRRNPTYIAYKPQTGFSEQRFTLHNHSNCSLRNYQQQVEKIQGGNLNVIWCDELVPANWVKELKARVATLGGWLLVTFTPITGYTSTVKMFLDRAQTTVKSTAFVIPRDGGEPRLDLALQGEDALAWIEGRSGQPAVPEGREFETVPRVMRMVGDKTSAVFFFYSFDNPFGNPANLYELYAAESAVGKKMRFYGLATKAMSGMFPKFNAAVHVVRADQVPTVGTRLQVVDPCSGRNWAGAWALVDRAPIGKRYWLYREWPTPGRYVPGVGDMGDWAVPGDKLDGERGPAQTSLGWGVDRYRDEFFRLEGRPDAPIADRPKQPTKFDQWDIEDPPPAARRRRRGPEDGEEITERLMDCRFGNTPTPTRSGETTLLELCAEVGFSPDFDPAPGMQSSDDRVHWVQIINNLLDYDDKQPIGPLNSPRLFVSEECANMIFALQNWTNADGLHGACMDFIAVLKYLVLHDPEDYSDRNAA